jgi:hypothetical protein
MVPSNSATDVDIETTGGWIAVVHNDIGELAGEPDHVRLYEADVDGSLLGPERELRPLSPVRPHSPRVLWTGTDHAVLYAGGGELFLLRVPGPP